MNDKELLVSFSVDCKTNDLSRVRNLLVDLGMMSVVASGTHLHGVCEMDDLQEIMRVLSKEKIGGLHHEIELVARPAKKVVH